ncbi:hypothetical protein Tco_1317272 [Tanacetum coccineum]
MEQYMSKTRTDYGSGVARPKIEKKDSFELKGQFLKELRENMFSGLDNKDKGSYRPQFLEAYSEASQIDESIPQKEKDPGILKDMNAYHNEVMDDVIVGKPFLREVGIKERGFDGMITIYNGDDEVTYQMVRAHPRFKNYTNKQCNKIPPLLKDPTLSEFRQWKNGSHAGTLVCMRPREGNIDEYWWRIYKSENLEVLES